MSAEIRSARKNSRDKVKSLPDEERVDDTIEEEILEQPSAMESSTGQPGAATEFPAQGSISFGNAMVQTPFY